MDTRAIADATRVIDTLVERLIAEDLNRDQIIQLYDQIKFQTSCIRNWYMAYKLNVTPPSINSEQS